MLTERHVLLLNVERSSKSHSNGQSSHHTVNKVCAIFL